MDFYFLLTVATVSIAVLALVLWLRTENLSFPLGIALLYYWSLYGAWSVVTDRVGGESGKRYEYLNVKMFPIDLDNDYYLALFYYTAFILLVELSVLACLARRPLKEFESHLSIGISHKAILLVVLVSGALSYLIIHEQLASAADFGMSAYIATRGGLGEMHPLFTVHQILNRMAIFALAIGFAVHLSGLKGRWLSASTNLLTGFLYSGFALIMFIFLAMLGNKNELFSGLILGGLVYLLNANQIRWSLIAMGGAVAFGGIASIDFLRGLPPIELLDHVNWWDALYWVPEIRSSNEAFGAHFSLYGVLHFHSQTTYGSSLIALVTSVIPRLYWPERPEAVYIHYAESLGIYEGATGQGYSIHHATGWYLNFGVWGLLVGAVLLGKVWATCYNAHVSATPGDRRWQNLLAIIAPAGFVSFIPPLIRAGPEAYKGMVIEAFLIPTLIVFLASVRWREVVRLPKCSSDVIRHKLPATEKYDAT